jgi:uncharacterized membrane protein
VTPGSLVRAAVLGIAAGLRTFMPHVGLAVRGHYGHGAGRTAILVAAGGELIGDKLPTAPSRTMIFSLAGRAGSGAAAGDRVAGRAGIALGAAGAVASSFGGERARAALVDRLDVADVWIALAEDALAIGLALAAAPRPPDPPSPVPVERSPSAPAGSAAA